MSARFGYLPKGTEVWAEASGDWDLLLTSDCDTGSILGPPSIAALHWSCKHPAYTPHNQNSNETTFEFLAFIVWLRLLPALFNADCRWQPCRSGSQGLGWESKAFLLPNLCWEFSPCTSWAHLAEAADEEKVEVLFITTRKDLEDV